MEQGKTSKYQHWMAEIEKAKKREKDFRKDGKYAIELYEADKERCKGNPFNILYSNTETIRPAVYNATPRPDVKPKNKRTKDPVVIHAARLAQDILSALLDTGCLGETSVDDLFRQAVTEGLTAGRGLAWLKYEAEVVEVQGIPVEVRNEKVKTTELPWNHFLHGYAAKWENVPWIAAIWHMSKEELKKNFGKGVLQGVEFKPTCSDAYAEVGEGHDKSDPDSSAPDLAVVYEIWDKASKKVLFLSDSIPEKFLKEVDDPLQLVGFYPCPAPLTFFRKVSSLVPVPLYNFYKKQAEELNDITERITSLIQAIRARGGYDAQLEEGMLLLKDADDGEYVAVPNVASLGNGQGTNLSNAIWHQPIKEPAMVVQQLYQQRESCKQVIYEITGISDILRGTNKASETATASDIKNQWGTLRLKESQKSVATFCRDTLRIMLEIAVSQFQESTIAALTEAPYPSSQEKQQAQMIAETAKASGMEVPPEVAEKLALPSMGELLAALKDDFYRKYSIDIETNSSVDVEATEDKKDFSELLNAISQFMNGVSPLIESGMMPMQAASEILVSIIRRFRLGAEVEDYIRAMGQQQKPAGSEADDAKAQAEAQKTQMEMQKLQMEAEVGKQKAQTEIALEQQKLQLEQQKAAMELKMMQMDFEFKQKEHALKLQMLQVQALHKATAAQQKSKQNGGSASASV